jgi:metal-dependent amidase/aminoacylase/carboxypeptidase family protein
MRFLGTLMIAAAVTVISATAQVNQLKENQQDRIAQGVATGKLTAGETANLEKKEAAINKQVRADRKANGGKLTAAEKKQVNHQQNQMSRKIYRDKHN